MLAVFLLVNCDVTPISHLLNKNLHPAGFHEKKIFSLDYSKENIEHFFTNHIGKGAVWGTEIAGV